MNKFISMIVALVVTLFTVNSFAWDPPHTPKPQSAILDQANVLSQDAHVRLDAQLKQINNGTSNEIAVLILPDLAGQSIEDVGIHTAKAWGVGKKDLDNGVLIVLAMKEHKSRIEVGKGAEGDLPDLKANDILKNVLRPHMRSGDVEGGLSATISAVSSTMASHGSSASSAPVNNGALCDVSPDGVGTNSGDVIALLFILGFGGFMILLAARTIFRARRQQAELMKRIEDEDNERITQNLIRQREAAKEAARKAKLAEELKKPTPVVEVPVIPRRKHLPSTASVPRVTHVPPSSNPVVHTSPVVAPVATTAVSLEQAEEAFRAAARRKKEQEEEDRRRRERDEEDRRRREREEEDRRRSESSSSSSYDSGSSSSTDWGGGGGGGFGGGDFGGGGSSGDW